MQQVKFTKMLATKANFGIVNSVLRNFVRGIQSNDSLLDECQHVRNRNPRNLEFLRIAHKHSGWTLDKNNRSYYHKLELKKSGRHITLELHHFENGPIISAATNEWAMKKQLIKSADTSAYKNLGRIMAQRCLESGISAVSPLLNENKNKKISLLLFEFKKVGISLKEPSKFKTPVPWEKIIQEKTWEIVP